MAALRLLPRRLARALPLHPIIRAPIVRPPPSRFPRSFSTFPVLRHSADGRDGLKNNRDLQQPEAQTAGAASPSTEPSISQSDLELLSKLSPAENRAEVPSYALVATCKQCGTRSAHKISKQGYHHGTVLLTCPGCKNRHLIADHLKIFSDTSITVEDILKEKGEHLKRITVGDGGDLEFVGDESKA